MNKPDILRRAIYCFFLAIPTQNFAAVSGRIISGAYLSKEIFRKNPTDRYNDSAQILQRFYLSTNDILIKNYEFVFDVRDKQDFFNKLDTEKLKLTPSNKLDIYQLYLKTPIDYETFQYKAGRFAENEAGAMIIDGIEFSTKKKFNSLSNNISFFAGFTPLSNEDTQISVSSDKKVVGVYDTLQSQEIEWGNYFYFSNALVNQFYKSSIDRTYFYNNSIWQSENHNITSLLYLDLNQKINIQNLWASYTNNILKTGKINFTASAIDSIQYKKEQDIRESLPSSQYFQTSLAFKDKQSKNGYLNEYKLTEGHRAYDHKNKTEAKYLLNKSDFYRENIIGTFNTGYRKNFSSNDLFAGIGLSYSNDISDYSINQDISYESGAVEGKNIAFFTDLSASHNFSRTLIGMFSLQNVWDKNVSILSLLFKLSYKFGDGATPLFNAPSKGKE